MDWDFLSRLNFLREANLIIIWVQNIEDIDDFVVN